VRNGFARAWLLGLAAILALVGLYGMWRIQLQYPSQWARILAQAVPDSSPFTTLLNAMQQVGDEHGPKANTRLELADFVQSNGRHIQVELVQGWFFEKSIEPWDVWQNLGRDVLLVSSVDESLSDRGDLSGPITLGCKLKKEGLQAKGSASLAECHGEYQTKFHINKVALLSAIVWTQKSGWTPCWQIGEERGAYESCVSEAIAGGLKDIFSQVDKSTDAIVFPAIGTGAGKLPKGNFYNTLFDTLIPELNGDRYLPSTIYLQVQRSEGEPDDNRWPETMSGIARALEVAVRRWNEPDHSHGDSEWLSLTGVALGGSLMLIGLAFGLRSGVLSSFLPIVARPRPLVIISWLAAAVGLVSVFKAFLGFFPMQIGPYLQVAVGALTAILCGPLVKAGHTVEDILRNDKDEGR
jgi:hypothetical protein